MSVNTSLSRFVDVNIKLDKNGDVPLVLGWVTYSTNFVLNTVRFLKALAAAQPHLSFPQVYPPPIPGMFWHKVPNDEERKEALASIQLYETST